jgi:hypothetical protein
MEWANSCLRMYSFEALLSRMACVSYDGLLIGSLQQSSPKVDGDKSTWQELGTYTLQLIRIETLTDLESIAREKTILLADESVRQ